MFKYIDCIDAGTEFCPCSLAERGECIICSQLRDKKFCDCLNWKGTCIYQDYLWNMEKAKKSREYKEFAVLHKEVLREDLFILKIKVNNYLARELSEFGAYVFMKRPEDIEAYGAPISILDSDIVENIITVAIKVEGAKTKALKIVDKTILIKGPFYNGIQGVNNLKSLKNGTCLILGRGVGTAPAVLAAKKLLYKENSIFILLDKGREKENYSKKYFKDLGCKDIEDVRFLNENKEILEETKKKIKNLIESKKIDVVLSAGSDNFHREILTYIYNLDKKIKLSTINNTTICCGEGLCGSCHIKLESGQVIRSCKQQYNPAEVFVKER